MYLLNVLFNESVWLRVNQLDQTLISNKNINLLIFANKMYIHEGIITA